MLILGLGHVQQLHDSLCTNVSNQVEKLSIFVLIFCETDSQNLSHRCPYLCPVAFGNTQTDKNINSEQTTYHG